MKFRSTIQQSDKLACQRSEDSREAESEDSFKMNHHGMFANPTGLVRGVLVLALAAGLVSCERPDRVEEATKNKIFLAGNGAEPKALDPHLVSSVGDSNIMRALFEGLVINHPSDDSAHLPGVAERWETTTGSDYKEWTFHLRKDAKWSNGDPVTARDFVYAYHRILDPKMPSPYASMLYFLVNGEIYNKNLVEEIAIKAAPNPEHPWESIKEVEFGANDQSENNLNKKGLNGLDLETLKQVQADLSTYEWPEVLSDEAKQYILDAYVAFYEAGRTVQKERPAGVVAKDDYTLVCNLEDPAPFFPDVVKHTTWLPVHQATIEKYGDMTDPFTEWQKPGNHVGNGAFQLTDWRINAYVRVRKNPHYWDQKTVKLNGIDFLPLDNQFTEERAFRDGLVHYTYIVPGNMIESYRKNQPEVLRVETYAGVYFFRCNTLKGPTKDVNFRRALAYSIDQETIVKYVTMGGQMPAYGFVPPSDAGYKPPNKIKFDPAKAKEFLKAAGYESGKDVPEFTILINTSEAHKAIAEAVQDMWKTHLGIEKVKISNQEWKVFQQTLKDIDYDVARSGWIADYVDPNTFLSLWNTTDSNNETGWSNPEYDRLLKEAAGVSDPAIRYKKLLTAESLLLDQLPILPVYWYTRVYLLHPDVKNWQPLLLDNHNYKFIDLEAADTPPVKP